MKFFKRRRRESMSMSRCLEIERLAGQAMSEGDDRSTKWTPPNYRDDLDKLRRGRKKK